MPEKYTTPYPAKRIYSDGRVEDIKVLLAKECPVKLFLDGKLFTTLFASPSELKELAVGHLITESVLSFMEIENVETEGSKVHIRTRKDKQALCAEITRITGKEEKANREIFVDSALFLSRKPFLQALGTSNLKHIGLIEELIWQP